MKKRLISILLTVLMVMSLFSGMSVSAYADDVIDSSYYKEYTLVEGDYVLRICQRMGINYYTCKEAIMALNNITSENGFRFLSVGTTVKIPVSDAHAVAIMKGQAVGSVGSTSGSGTADVSGNASVAYYLVPHAMAYGETVLGVCNTFGTNFNQNAELIKNVNGIKNWNNVHAGSTVLIPVYKTPAVGTTCYAVMNHKVASGETTYGICGTYGISYGASQKLMQAVNGNSNLAAIKAGATLKVPVVTTIKAASTGSNGSGSADKNNSSSNNNSNSDNSNNTSTAAKTYELNSNINAELGSMEFYVDNKKVDTAAEGAVVTVVVNTKDNKAVESLIVKYANGKADVKLESNTFIMPACDVRVDATVNSGYDINFESNYSFKTAAKVDGITVTSAAADKSVKIVSTDPSYEITSIKVIKTGFLGKKTEVPVNDNNSFVMPDTDVTVKVELAPVKTYNFYRNDSENGSFDIQIDGNSVSKAAKGAQVTIVWQPASGYQIDSIKVYPHGKEHTSDNEINVFNNSFTMPDSHVDVVVEFEKTVNHIEIEAITGAVLRAYLSSDLNNAITEANTGDTVVIQAVRDADKFGDDGYTAEIKELTVTRNADGHLVNVNENDWSFTMPAGGVTITGKVNTEMKDLTVSFYSADSKQPVANSGNSVTVKNTTDSSDVLNAKDNAANNTKSFAVGTKFALSTDTTRDSHSFVEYKVLVDGTPDQELTKQANQGQFKMPYGNVEIQAYFAAEDIAIPAAKITGKGTVSYMSAAELDNFNSAVKCKVGDWVKIIAVPADDKTSVVDEDCITVIDNATGDHMLLTLHEGNYCFQMPADGVTIAVRFEGKPHTVTVLTRNADDPADLSLQGKSLVLFDLGTKTPYVENNVNGTKVEVVSGAAAGVLLSDLGKADYTIAKVELTGSNGTKYEQGIEYNASKGFYGFWMEDDDMTVTVYLKQKAASTFSIKSISYPTAQLTADATVLTNGSFVSANECKAGDIVFVRTSNVVAPYYVDENSLKVVRSSDSGSLGVNANVIAKDEAATTNIGSGDLYPVEENDEIVGWLFRMPDGGVKSMTITTKIEQFDLTLKVKDTNDVDLSQTGLVQLTFKKNDVQVDLGDLFTKVDYKSNVAVALTKQGADQYTIKNVEVDVPEVTVSKNAFTMPGSNVTLTVTLEDKTSATSPFSLKSSYTGGTLEFYTDNTMTVKYNGKANAGEKVFVRVLPSKEYDLKSITITGLNNSDLTGGATANLTADGYEFVMPEDGVRITPVFEKKVRDITFEFTAVAGNRLKVVIGNNTHYLETSGTKIEDITYGTAIKVSMENTKTHTVNGAQDVTPEANREGIAAFANKNPSSGVISLSMPGYNAVVNVGVVTK